LERRERRERTPEGKARRRKIDPRFVEVMHF
jgi:hypothetical protein